MARSGERDAWWIRKGWQQRFASANYEPNSRGSPVQTGEALSQPLEIHGMASAQAQERHQEDTDFVQAGNLYQGLRRPGREGREGA
ncbi:MAG: hypothetical protein NTU62_12165 [Spirochaetes bacterium]|nr:hypothetical protein [Spirochaetota bacterium]